jgi:hypothetical protein
VISHWGGPKYLCGLILYARVVVFPWLGESLQNWVKFMLGRFGCHYSDNKLLFILALCAIHFHCFSENTCELSLDVLAQI